MTEARATRCRRLLARATLVPALALAAIAAPAATGAPATSCAEDAVPAVRSAPPWVNLDGYLAARRRATSHYAPVARVRGPSWVNLDAYLAARRIGDDR